MFNENESMYEVGDWVRFHHVRVVSEIVEVRGAEYLVRTPKVAVETENLHLVPSDEIKCRVNVEDSHVSMAVDHLEYACEELIAAGRVDDAEKIFSFAVELVGLSEAGTENERKDRT